MSWVRGRRKIVVPENITSILRRKKIIMASLIQLPEQRSLLKMQQIAVKKRKLKTPHQYPKTLS
jgi:hypothetical protein